MISLSPFYRWRNSSHSAYAFSQINCIHAMISIIPTYRWLMLSIRFRPMYSTVILVSCFKSPKGTTSHFFQGYWLQEMATPICLVILETLSSHLTFRISNPLSLPIIFQCISSFDPSYPSSITYHHFYQLHYPTINCAAHRHYHHIHSNWFLHISQSDFLKQIAMLFS